MPSSVPRSFQLRMLCTGSPISFLPSFCPFEDLWNDAHWICVWDLSDLRELLQCWRCFPSAWGKFCSGCDLFPCGFASLLWVNLASFKARFLEAKRKGVEEKGSGFGIGLLGSDC